MDLINDARRGFTLGLHIAAAWGLLLLAADICRADLVWEDHFADEAALGDGSSIITPDGTTVMFDRTVQSGQHWFEVIGIPIFLVDDLTTYGNSDFFTMEEGIMGQHAGYLELAFDNSDDDPDDYLELALNFDRAVSDLRFSLMDIDSGSWDDGVEVFYNGNNNVRDNPAITALFGSTVALDNESGMHGWEGDGSGADDDETSGNIDFDFGSLQVTSLRIRYFSTDDASSNPGGQRAGLSDLQFTASTPEPSSTACMAVFVAALCSNILRRRRWSAEAGRTRSAVGRG